MRTFKLTLAYDGTAYEGWQVQPGRPTIQDALETAIEEVTCQRVRAVASGRTDAGVHAFGQVVAFSANTSLSCQALRRALNANLPRDIAVLDAAEAPADFHPIRDARRKRYRYVIYDGAVRDVFFLRFAWHYPYGRLDAAAMQRAAKPLLGRHDFRSFQTAGADRKTSVRTVFELPVRRGSARNEPLLGNPGEGSDGQDWILLEIEADGFLYNMVRAIVGTLTEVGRGARLEHWPAEVLAARDRRVAGPTAPPHGLFLVNVTY
ncbi:MAG: tRNA pseudouridine(38-40) synthase TruA [Thermoguttaceae bacterium]|nr:tRNA pseudouridine(38-40) synthase TruA [Thermoguttaceae bacterium]